MSSEKDYEDFLREERSRVEAELHRVTGRVTGDDDLPPGYRWATAEESVAHGITPNPAMIVVPRTVDADGIQYTQGEADLALPDLPPLPRDEDGFIQTSAAYGHITLVRVTYNTDPEGVWVDDDDYSNVTLHGPFADEAEAQAWMEAYPDGDRDLKDMDVITVNLVRPEATS